MAWPEPSAVVMSAPGAAATKSNPPAMGTPVQRDHLESKGAPNWAQSKSLSWHLYSTTASPLVFFSFYFF